MNRKYKDFSNSPQEDNDVTIKDKKYHENNASNINNKVILIFIKFLLIICFVYFLKKKVKKLAAKQRGFEKTVISFIEQNNKLLEQNSILLQEMKENSLRFNIN